MLPFLKDRHSGSFSGELVKQAETKEDEPGDWVLKEVAKDLLRAIESKDSRLLESVLEVLCNYISDKDEIQDQEDLKE